MATYNSNSISSKITSDYPLSRDLVIKWNNIREVLLKNHIVSTVEITPVDAERYLFDLHGLCISALRLPEYQVYPHMIVNGYTSSYDYNGELLRFKLIDSGKLLNYYRLFLRD